jgi:hypothetical protein
LYPHNNSITIKSMGVSTESVNTNTIEKNPRGQERTGLPGFVEKQYKRWLGGQKERTIAFREMVAGEERGLDGSSQETFAKVLTDEFLAIDKEAKADLSLELPKWKAQLVDVVSHNFRKHNTDKNYSTEGKSSEETYNAYYSLFDKLLRSEDPDEARQWLNTAMIATEQQIVAIQLGTGANMVVAHEAEHIDHVEEPEAMAATISSEMGVPIDQVSADLSKTRRFLETLYNNDAVFMLSLGNSPWIARAVEFMYKRDPGRRIKWENETKILEMMGQFQVESRKRVHSDVEVVFEHGAKYRLDREYRVSAIAAPVELDETQKNYLRSQKILGTVLEGDVMDRKAQGEVSALLKRLTHARQDAYYVEFDEQLRTKEHLNLLRPVNADLSIAVNSGLGGVNPGVEGMGVMTVGLDATIPLEQQLEGALSAIQKTVDRERLDDVATGDMVANVGEQVTTLDVAVKAKELTQEQKEKKEHLVEDKKTLEAQKADLKKHEDLSKEIETEDEKIIRAKAESAAVVTAEGALKKVEGEIKTKTSEKTEFERLKDSKVEEIKEFKEQKKKAQERVRELTEQKAARNVQNTAENSRLADVNTRIQEIDNWNASPPADANQMTAEAYKQERATLIQQRLQLQTSITAYTPANKLEIKKMK